MPKILIADDDRNICELLKLYLDHEGYQVLFAHDGSEALNLIQSQVPDVLLLDIMLPIINGWEVCKMVRKNSALPIIMLTARDSIEDKLEGLDIGADDYVVKPFDPKEVVARVKVQLRRNGKALLSDPKEEVISIDNLVVNLTQYEVRHNNELIELKPKEVQLLYFLMQNRNIVFDREKLLEQVWGYEFVGETRTVDVHVKRLREKLQCGSECAGRNSRETWDIKTIWGVGYKFEVR